MGPQKFFGAQGFLLSLHSGIAPGVSGDIMGCWGLNSGQPYAGQMPFPLSCYSGPYFWIYMLVWGTSQAVLRRPGPPPGRWFNVPTKNMALGACGAVLSDAWGTGQGVQPDSGACKHFPNLCSCSRFKLRTFFLTWALSHRAVRVPNNVVLAFKFRTLPLPGQFQILCHLPKYINILYMHLYICGSIKQGT